MILGNADEYLLIWVGPWMDDVKGYTQAGYDVWKNVLFDSFIKPYQTSIIYDGQLQHIAYRVCLYQTDYFANQGNIPFQNDIPEDTSKWIFPGGQDNYENTLGFYNKFDYRRANRRLFYEWLNSPFDFNDFKTFADSMVEKYKPNKMIWCNNFQPDQFNWWWYRNQTFEETRFAFTIEGEANQPIFNFLPNSIGSTKVLKSAYHWQFINLMKQYDASGIQQYTMLTGNSLFSAMSRAIQNLRRPFDPLTPWVRDLYGGSPCKLYDDFETMSFERPPTNP